jgi:hypothetical protein
MSKNIICSIITTYYLITLLHLMGIILELTHTFVKLMRAINIRFKFVLTYSI